MHHMPLTEFLTARLDEEETIARRALFNNGNWTHEFRFGEETRVRLDFGPDVAQGRGTLDASNHAHIARHDPARVLSDIEAKRRLIAFHEKWPMRVEISERPSITEDPANMANVIATMSKRMVWLENQAYRNTFGDEPPTSFPLLAIAQVYRDHPDFDPAWTLKEEA